MKNITLIVQVPDDMNFIACQPFGTWTAFKNKPIICKDDSEYWDFQGGELELSDLGPQTKNWKNTLREI